jgi:integrase
VRGRVSEPQTAVRDTLRAAGEKLAGLHDAYVAYREAVLALEDFRLSPECVALSGGGDDEWCRRNAHPVMEPPAADFLAFIGELWIVAKDADDQGYRDRARGRAYDEQEELADGAGTEARDATLVAAATGLRRGELFGLRWRDIDFKTNEIHVSAYNFAGKVEDGRFKTDAGERDVPLFKSIRRLLLERKTRQRYKRPDDLVFATRVGTPIDPNNFVKRELKAAVKAANEARPKKEPPLPALPAFRCHDFRHYAVSMLIAQKADILTLARIAGHADPNVTLKVNGHLMKGALSEVAEKFEPPAHMSKTASAWADFELW